MPLFAQADITIFVLVLAVGLVLLLSARRLLKYSAPHIFVGILGLIVGLALGALLGLPLNRLPDPYGRFLPIVVEIVVAIAVVDFFIAQTGTISDFFRGFFTFFRRLARLERVSEEVERGEVLIDSSVFVDGRVEEIAKSGFLLGKLVVPRFVIDELQTLADSADELKRNRGRRGLDVLRRLSKEPAVKLDILDIRLAGRKVDEALATLAKRRGAKILTTDYNLNRVAEIIGVSVLNINELAQALRPILLPGERIMVRVIGEGKEAGQGVGYLPDGTLIVVEGGRKHIGAEIEVTVERIFQSVSGKMIFCSPKGAKKIAEA